MEKKNRIAHGIFALMAFLLTLALPFKAIQIFAQQKGKGNNEEKNFTRLENADSLELIFKNIMALPQVHVSRPEEEDDNVILRFNEESSRTLGGINFNMEENEKGILLTVPRVDHHKTSKITFKKRVLNFDFEEEFNEGWFLLDSIDKETFQIIINE